ncbi:vicilin Jug r 2.0101-like [Rosa chinensis]|nr:vicilin Jug r 2.0101-like [Rosa chinensis]
MVMRASPKQLQALSQHASSPRSKGRQSGKGPFNLRNQKPIQANEFGKLFEARPEKFGQLQDMDVSVTCVEVNNEAMMLPHYNSKAIFVVLVVEGSGRVEMACPHMASQSQMGEEEVEQQGEQVKVTADVSEGDVFVIPAGHPIAIVAQNQQLKMLGFGINAQNNKRNFIAGREANPIREMEREAKQLTFGQEMEQIINRQRESYFAPTGQSQQQRGGRDEPLSSILAFTGF